ncbi:FkbM family methyltransferase [Thiocapsa bogorovii]|uniref:FkbM family methyltransferase n=1 Tax=Thiocapsa bogorovii TaxID=521689 RepID=UPI001E3AEFBA|nr:FkbM family methyltransferase [Thiocapsa bogorovii]UHD15471.1 FkbM family methyltransferase [Thiocapsa bogorovii]
MNRIYWRFLWSHDLWLHRALVRLYYRLARLIPFSVKYFIGRTFRKNRYPYRLVKEGAVVVQIGAPKDTLLAGRSRAMYFSLFAGTSGRVLIVEPDPESEAAFSQIMETHHQTNILLSQMAAWSQAQTLRIYVSDTHPATNFTEGSKQYDEERLKDYRVVELPADTLDSIVRLQGLERVDLVSITTNGAEREILAGMSGLIAAGLPFICLARTGENYEDMMAELGYHLLAHDDRGFTFEQRPQLGTT